jgi:hypothetical protein
MHSIWGEGRELNWVAVTWLFKDLMLSYLGKRRVKGTWKMNR